MPQEGHGEEGFGSRPASFGDAGHDAFAVGLEAGVTNEQSARLHPPIGLDLGAWTPWETAVSIDADSSCCVRARCPATVVVRRLDAGGPRDLTGALRGRLILLVGAAVPIARAVPAAVRCGLRPAVVLPAATRWVVHRRRRERPG
ncbi:XdhC family protein [Streptomyces sp. SLBN-115]|uniref:XdhC family protein n=1 Tax=Streptomyces sp. SLBN-115 TaxID=2768453 RepID=UPI003FCC7DA5